MGAVNKQKLGPRFYSLRFLFAFTLEPLHESPCSGLWSLSAYSLTFFVFSYSTELARSPYVV